MSFATYLHENRDQLIDHRADGKIPVETTLLDPERDVSPIEEGPPPGRFAATAIGAATQAALSRLTRKTRERAPRAHYQQVTPFFRPSYFAQPLPYIEPWERR